MKKRPDITAQTRENLIQAFWGLYRQKRIEQISIKEITTLAGYTRGTFYEYFVDIYDVLNQLEDGLLGYLREKVLDSLGGRLSDDIIQKLGDIYDTKGEYLGTLLGETGDPNFANKLKSVMRPALVNTFGLPEEDMHTSYIFEFGMSAIIGTITHWYNNKKNLPSEEIVRLIRSMLAGGVLPEIKRYSYRSFSVPG
ncbi:MAG TPA: TetR/AcrR family transcriptional regulator [Anaerolineales bacterium]|nr:TetR/AcrR family transcriptional regulator [Anaerolineales bacterium]